MWKAVIKGSTLIDFWHHVWVYSWELWAAVYMLSVWHENRWLAVVSSPWQPTTSCVWRQTAGTCDVFTVLLGVWEFSSSTSVTSAKDYCCVIMWLKSNDTISIRNAVTQLLSVGCLLLANTYTFQTGLIKFVAQFSLTWTHPNPDTFCFGHIQLLKVAFCCQCCVFFENTTVQLVLDQLKTSVYAVDAPHSSKVCFHEVWICETGFRFLKPGSMNQDVWLRNWIQHCETRSRFEPGFGFVANSTCIWNWN